MSKYDKTILLMFLGSPGSGKSYFAKNIAEKLNAIRINGDSMRIAMFGSIEGIEHAKQTQGRDSMNSQVFGALDYLAEQVLQQGTDVVYDAHHLRRSTRQNLYKLVKKNRAIPLLIWIQTPHDVALRRGQLLEATADQRKNNETEMRKLIARHEANMELPNEDENVIAIDGQKDFTEQWDSFTLQARGYLL